MTGTSFILPSTPPLAILWLDYLCESNNETTTLTNTSELSILWSGCEHLFTALITYWKHLLTHKCHCIYTVVWSIGIKSSWLKGNFLDFKIRTSWIQTGNMLSCKLNSWMATFKICIGIAYNGLQRLIHKTKFETNHIVCQLPDLPMTFQQIKTKHGFKKTQD